MNIETWWRRRPNRRDGELMTTFHWRGQGSLKYASLQCEGSPCLPDSSFPKDRSSLAPSLSACLLIKTLLALHRPDRLPSSEPSGPDSKKTSCGYGEDLYSQERASRAPSPWLPCLHPETKGKPSFSYPLTAVSTDSRVSIYSSVLITLPPTHWDSMKGNGTKADKLNERVFTLTKDHLVHLTGKEAMLFK